MPLAHVELASLNFPVNPQAEARVAELTRPNGVELRPSDRYEAKDPSGFIVVTVDRTPMVTNVRIRQRWDEHVRPEAFPTAVFNTYMTAVQRAAAVEAAHGSASPPTASATPEPMPFLDPSAMPLEQWMAGIRSQLSAIDDEYDAIRRREQAPQQGITEIRSPLGYLTMGLRDGGPIGIKADPHVLRNPSETVLSEEILHLFVQAGLGIASGERPRPARPQAAVDETDDEYFSDVNVFEEGN